MAGTTTPVTVVAKVTDASSRAVAGATVSWASSGGSITPTSATDASGQASAQWTPGTIVGSEVATATVTGVAGNAAFAIQIAAGPLAKIRITPDTVKLTGPGNTSPIAVSGADAFDNTVNVLTLTFTTDNPRVATVAPLGTAGALVTAVAPGTANILATSGSVSGSTVALVKAPPCSDSAGLSLQVGQVTTLIGAAASEICVQGATGAEFVAIPFFGLGDTTGATLSFTVDPVATSIAFGPPSPSIGATTTLRKAFLSGGRELQRDAAWEHQFRERAMRELRPKMSAARSAAQISPSGVRKSLSVATAAVGDSITLNVSLAGCTDPVFHQAAVMSVSNNAIVLNDTQNPDGGFTQSDWDFFAAAFDTLVVPVDTLNFGAPIDVDGNGRVLLLFTTVVNQLTHEGSSSFVGGFFHPRDIFPKTNTPRAQACATSNFAEMFYLLAPDPSGTINKNMFSTSFVRSITVGTVAHEFQHLINAERHLWVNTNTTQFEDTFLDEGLAHMAEELTFYRASGLSPRANIALGTLQGSGQRVIDANFNYGRQNQLRFKEYLTQPEINSLYSEVDGLATRGATWSFLRYAADRKGGVERDTWFNLVNVNNKLPNGESPHGLSNLTQMFGTDIVSEIRDYTIANYVDDAGIAGIPDVVKHLSWNHRSIESSLSSSSNTYPLKTQPLTAGTRVSLTLVDGGAAYLRFAVAAGAVGGAGFAPVAAGSLPTSFSVSVVRTK